MQAEKLGPAERIMQSVLTYTDHLVHNRPGLVVPDGRTNTGVRWDFATYKEEKRTTVGVVLDGEPTEKVVYRLSKVGKKSVATRAGVLAVDGVTVNEGGRKVGEWRGAGIFPEVAVWMYRQVAEVWKLDNEFSARWASYQFGQEHRNMQVVLAAFMLVQSRKGAPVLDQGKVAFFDDDYRDVGEAMMLIYSKDKGLNPKLLLRIRELLEIPGVAAINQELGFGVSLRHPTLGRWTKVVHKWLRYREENPKLLEGLVKAGFKNTVRTLCARSGYKPESPAFFQALRWKQSQAEDGRRQIAIGQAVQLAETWEGLTEEQICERILKDKPGYKRLVSLIPPKPGLTRAIVAAAIEAGSLSDKDLIIATPTLEELGLLEVQDIKTRWDRAVRAANDMRAANIAARVKGTAVKEQLVEASEGALKKATEEVLKAMRVYVFVDRSGSMETAIQEAIKLITKLLPAFPLDKMHVAYFNTFGTEVKFKAATGAAVAHAFTGVAGTGGTSYGAGVTALQHHKPADDEDVIFLFIGDQQAPDFAAAVQRSGLRPMAFGFLYVAGNAGSHAKAVENTATQLGIPCFLIDDKIFADTYAIPRTLRALISATPVGVSARTEAPRPRVTLVETIIKTDLLTKPVWAA